MSLGELLHKGYRITASKQGIGWVVFIYPPGGTRSIAEHFLPTQSPNGRTKLVAQAIAWIGEKIAAASRGQ